MNVYLCVTCEGRGPEKIGGLQKKVSQFQTWIIYEPEGRRPLGRPRRRWMDNTRMDLQEVGRGYMDWIGLAQDRDRWLTLVSAVMNLRVSWNAGNFLTSCKPVSFSRGTLHHGVSIPDMRFSHACCWRLNSGLLQRMDLNTGYKSAEEHTDVIFRVATFLGLFSSHRQQADPKRWHLYTSPKGVITQKTGIFLNSSRT